MKKIIEQKLVQTKKRESLLNSEEVRAIAKVEAELIKGARKYFEEHGFTEVVVPHITKATGSCENINTLFEVDHFGKKSFLVQTGQLYLESLIPRMGNVFCTGSSFRAEPDIDERHLTEFQLLEIEFPGDFEMLLEHIEGTIKSMISTALKNASGELSFLGVDTAKLALKEPFKRITYTEAVKSLEGFGVKWGDDLKSSHEKHLVKKFGENPLFITHFPEKIKFFNMRRNPQNPEIVNSADLILPFGGEAVGSAEREFEYPPLKKRLEDSLMLQQLKALGGGIEDFGWYMDFVKNHGGQLHSGCGIGLNRVTQFVLQSEDIRTTTPFPMNRESLM